MNENLPRINNQAHQLRMLEMDLADNPMENSLAGPIRRHRERTLVHSTDTPHGASNADEFRALALLQQRERGLEEVQRAQTVDIDVFLDDGRVAGSEAGEVVADACVGDDEVEAGDPLVFERGYGVGWVGWGFVVDFDDDEFAGGVFGEGGEFLGCGVFGVTDAGDDGGVGAGEVDLDEAEADAWVLFSGGLGDGERCLPRLAPVMRKLVGLPPGILDDVLKERLVSLERR